MKLCVILALVSGTLSSDIYEKCTTTDCNGKVGCATIYQHRYFRGWYQCQTFLWDECRNLNDWWSESGGRVSSVDSHRTCVRLYSLSGCYGSSIEIRTGTLDHDNLKKLDFEDNAQSMSSCLRLKTYDSGCVIKTLFATNIKPSEITQETTNILRIVDTVTQLITTGLAAAGVPYAKVLQTGLKFIFGLFDNKKMSESVDDKIVDGFTQNSGSQISAKMHIIKKRLDSVLSETTPLSHKLTDISLALHTCEEIAKLFSDDSYTFTKNKVGSSPYLVSFAAVYITVAKIISKFRPELKDTVRADIAQFEQLTNDYLTEALKQRKDQITYDVYRRDAHVVVDRLLCKSFDFGIFGDTFGESSKGCLNHPACLLGWDGCSKCISDIRSTIDTKMKVFYQPMQDQLKHFSFG